MLMAAVPRQGRRGGWRGGRVETAWHTVWQARFVQVAVPCRRGVPSWDVVRAVAGREAGRLLLPAGWTPPIHSGVAAFAGVALAGALMRQTAAWWSRHRSMSGRCRWGIVDPVAADPGLPLQCLRQTNEVTVVTARPQRYAEAQRRAMTEWGAVMRVSDDPAWLRGCALVLVPDRWPPGLTPTEGLWLSAKATAPHPRVIDGYCPDAPAAVWEATPPGCDRLAFAAGLYELSGLTALAAAPPVSLRRNGQWYPLPRGLA